MLIVLTLIFICSQKWSANSYVILCMLIKKNVCCENPPPHRPPCATYMPVRFITELISRSCDNSLSIICLWKIKYWNSIQYILYSFFIISTLPSTFSSLIFTIYTINIGLDIRISSWRPRKLGIWHSLYLFAALLFLCVQMLKMI